MKRKSTVATPPIDEEIEDIIFDNMTCSPPSTSTSNNNCCNGSGKYSNTSNTILEKQLEINHHLNNKLLDYVMGMTSQVFATAMQTMQHTQQVNEQLDQFKIVNKQKDMILEDKLNTKMREALEKSIDTVGTVVPSTAASIGGIVEDHELPEMMDDNLNKAMDKFQAAIDTLKELSEFNKSMIPDELAKERGEWEKKMSELYQKKPPSPKFDRVQTVFGDPTPITEEEQQKRYEDATKLKEQQDQQYTQKFPLPQPARPIDNPNTVTNGS